MYQGCIKHNIVSVKGCVSRSQWRTKRKRLEKKTEPLIGLFLFRLPPCLTGCSRQVGIVAEKTEITHPNSQNDVPQVSYGGSEIRENQSLLVLASMEDAPGCARQISPKRDNKGWFTLAVWKNIDYFQVCMKYDLCVTSNSIWCKDFCIRTTKLIPPFVKPLITYN